MSIRHESREDSVVTTQITLSLARLCVLLLSAQMGRASRKRAPPREGVRPCASVSYSHPVCLTKVILRCQYLTLGDRPQHFEPKGWLIPTGASGMMPIALNRGHKLMPCFANSLALRWQVKTRRTTRSNCLPPRDVR